MRSLTAQGFTEMVCVHCPLCSRLAADLVSLDGLDHGRAAAPSITELVVPQIQKFLARVDSEVAATT